MASTKQAVEAPPPVVPELTMRLPELFAPVDVAIGASEALRIADGAKVVGADGRSTTITNVGTAETNVGVDAAVGDVVSIAPVTLRGTNLQNFFNVNGDVTSSGTVTPQNNAAVSGDIRQNVTLSSRAFERALAMPTTTGPDVTVFQGA